MLLRVLIAAGGIPLIILLIYAGLLPFSILVTAIVVPGLLEYVRILKLKGILLHNNFVIILGSLLPFFFFLQTKFNIDFYGLSMIVPLIVLFCIQLFQRSLLTTIRDIGSSLLGIIYIGFFTSHLILIRGMEKGVYYLLFLFVILWFSDTSGYIAWKILGRKRHLIPLKVSPNKSFEGYIGEILFSVLGAFFVKWLLGAKSPFSFAQCALLGIVIAIAGAVGDLAESTLKRDAGIKDSGKLLPGHGGILDRFDSLIFSAPVLYYILKFNLI